MTPDEAFRTIAYEVITAAAEDAGEWEEFPRIGEHDWNELVDHVGSILGSIRPTSGQVRDAYELLAARGRVMSFDGVHHEGWIEESGEFGDYGPPRWLPFCSCGWTGSAHPFQPKAEDELDRHLDGLS